MESRFALLESRCSRWSISKCRGGKTSEVQETKQTRYSKTGHASFAEPHNEPNQVFGA